MEGNKLIAHLSNKHVQITIAVLLLMVLYVAGRLFGNKLIINHKITTGIIKDYYIGGRGHAGRTTLLYTFYLDGVKHNSSAQAGECYSSELIKSKLIGKSFPVIYNPDHLSLNYILVCHKDFEYYKIPIPDSLNWIN